MTTQLHAELASEDFRRGIAYAAHAMLHTVNAAHGESGRIPAEAGLKHCCANEVLAFAQGIAATLNNAAGGEYEHPHDPDHHAAD